MLDTARSWQTSLARRSEAFLARSPLRRRLWSLIRGMRRDRIGRVASAMAFNLFLAAIPLLALAGWLFARLLQNSPSAMASMSLLVDLTPEEARELIERHFRLFSAQAVAPVAVFGALW